MTLIATKKQSLLRDFVDTLKHQPKQVLFLMPLKGKVKIVIMFANVKSIPPFVVAAMNHFIHIFNHGISNFNVRIKKLVKML